MREQQNAAAQRRLDLADSARTTSRMPAPQLDALPPTAREAIERFAEDVAGKLGANVVSIALYGGVAKGRFEETTSDLNVLVVLGEVSLAALDQVGASAAVAERAVRVQLLTLAEGDLADCTEVFATKFLDIKRHHVLLRGRDVLSELAISRERVVRQARRELVNAKLRTRQAYLARLQRPEALDAIIDRGRKTAQVNLEAVLGCPEAADTAAVLEALAPFQQPEPEGAMEEQCATFLRQLDAALRALGPA